MFIYTQAQRIFANVHSCLDNECIYYWETKVADENFEYATTHEPHPTVTP